MQNMSCDSIRVASAFKQILAPKHTCMTLGGADGWCKRINFEFIIYVYIQSEKNTYIIRGFERKPMAYRVHLIRH